MQSRKEIVVLEDNPYLLEVYVELLGNDFIVRPFSDSLTFIAEIIKKNVTPAVFVTDLYLREASLIDIAKDENILKILKTWQCLVVSVKDDIETMRNCLDEWASDYLIKPFNTKELVNKCHILAARSDSIRLNSVSMQAFFQGASSCELSAKEFQVLSYLVAENGMVEKNQLISRLWGEAHSPNILNTVLARLRPKLDAIGYNIQIARDGNVKLFQSQFCES